MSEQFEREVIDRLARMETKQDHYQAEVKEMRATVKQIETKVYSIAAIISGIAATLTYLGSKLFTSN